MMYSTDRYNNTSGSFKVPPGGDGFYYFSVYLLVLQSHVTVFDIAINEQIICTAYAEQLSSTDDEKHILHGGFLRCRRCDKSFTSLAPCKS